MFIIVSFSKTVYFSALFYAQPCMQVTRLRREVNGAIFQGWLRAKIVQGYERLAAHAPVMREFQ